MAETQHPITPPLDLIKLWLNEWDMRPSHIHVATAAARWGADAELEACVGWLSGPCPSYGRELRAARRPKPPSLKEQALLALEQVDEWAVANVRQFTIHDDLVSSVETIRRALEQLPND